MEKVSISVRELVEFILRTGDLDSGFMSASRAQEGTKAHKKLQKSNEELFEKYNREVTLSFEASYEEFSIVIEGRADGIIEEKGDIIIEEIKSTQRDLSLIEEAYNELHWAQVKSYGYIYASKEGLDSIKLQLTYFDLTTEETKSFLKSFNIKELEEFFYGLVDSYYSWARDRYYWGIKRDQSIKGTDFPFESYRRGQRELAVAVYGTIKENKKLFAEAPTGIGKTISTIFPAVKAMGEGLINKIFYLTAKTITRTVGEEAFNRLRTKGLKMRVITLTAKDKICFNKEAACNGEQCEYAKGHYDRVNAAIMDLITNEESFTREIIEAYAKKHRVCPFEFSLDLALFSDAIICDYNYAFDPSAALKRFFDVSVVGKGKSKDSNKIPYALLIDEGHNLVDRAREMFSEELLKSKILEAKKLMKGRAQNLYKSLDKINSYMIDLRHQLEEEDKKSIVTTEPPEEIYILLRIFMKEAEEYLIKNRNTEGYEEILDLYFNFNSFLNIGELYGENYVTYVDSENKDIKLKLFCVDPSKNLKETMNKVRSTILFSATLNPMDYFKELLGHNAEDYNMRLPSPFNRENLKVNIADKISTKYIHRENSYEAIATYIRTFIKGRKGNYMVFFPSYAYMNRVHEDFVNSMSMDEKVDIILQDSSMTEENREEFLKTFDENNENTLVAFAVLGGVFSEGIDLTGDKLIGAIIVGVGLPQLCLERDIIKDYYNEKLNKGYEYSYMYPGMNKVLQAAGRVIRTEKDRGTLMLIDQRFINRDYESLFPREWFPYVKLRDQLQLQRELKEFWEPKQQTDKR